jgi:hypothetical protein
LGFSANLEAKPARAAPARSASLPVFDFLGQNTETPTTMTTLNGEDCRVQGDNTLLCASYQGPGTAGPKIGGIELLTLRMTFSAQKLFLVEGRANRTQFASLLEAFTLKYGRPQMAVRKWQNQAGASFDNTVASWTFKGGKLELTSIGAYISQSQFTFVSQANSPTRNPPKIDF